MRAFPSPVSDDIAGVPAVAMVDMSVMSLEKICRGLPRAAAA
jgi:hypothetical protein